MRNIARKIAVVVLASSAGALCAAAPPASLNPKLVSNAPWWERITVTLAADGNPQSCSYETSLASKPADCDLDAATAGMTEASADRKGEVTRITFERRFTPVAPANPKLQAGDTLLGGQVMALAIDARGAVKDCKVVAVSGAVRPQYSCDDASAERFDASIGGAKPANRGGYMTVLVYGHAEHMV